MLVGRTNFLVLTTNVYQCRSNVMVKMIVVITAMRKEIALVMYIN